MSTPKQIAANRTNARKSTGPKSAAGKQTVSVNALRHGLTGRTVVLPADDLDLYKTHVKTLTASLKPETPEETQLAALIADNYWRLQRIQSIEDGIFALQYADDETLATHPQANTTLNQPKAYLNHAKELERLTLYESRIHRNIKSATARLETLQSDRRAARAAALEQAKLLFRLHAGSKRQDSEVRMPDLPSLHSPQTDTPGHGFEFSSTELTHAIQLEDQLHQARKLRPVLAKAA